MIRSILWVCTVSVVTVGCAAPSGESPARQTEGAVWAREIEGATRANAQPTAEQISLSNDVREVIVARWQGFQALARQLPSREVLAVELLRTRQDQSVVVLTVVENSEPRRYVVMADARGAAYPAEQQAEAIEAAAPPNALLALDGSAADPAAVTLGEPPPKEGGRPGIIAVGERLLTASFSSMEMDSAALLQIDPARQAKLVDVASPCAPQVATGALHNVLLARGEGFKRLAETLPDRRVLAVELVRTLLDETIAVFTVVRNGEPVRYMITADARGRVMERVADHCTGKSASDLLMAMAVEGPAQDPSIIAIGEPPPKQGGPAGVVAVGENLLGAAFHVAELVDTSGK